MHYNAVRCREFHMLFGIQILQLMLFGYDFTQDLRHIKIVICNQDQTALSRQVIPSVLAAPEYFDSVH